MLTEAKVRVRFHGLFGAVLPREGQPLRLLFVDVRRGRRPLGLQSEDPVPPHVAVVEFRGPVVVNGVELLGGGYFGLDGHDVTVLPGIVAADSFEGPGVDIEIEGADAGTPLPDAAHMPELVEAKMAGVDASLLKAPVPRDLVARVHLPRGSVSTGDPSQTDWELGPGVRKRLARELHLDPRLDACTLEARSWKSGGRRLFHVEPLADQDVDVLVSNVCGILPSSCAQPAGRDDEDFRALFDLLDTGAQQSVRDAIGAGELAGIPYPKAGIVPENFRPLPCYYTVFAPV